MLSPQEIAVAGCGPGGSPPVDAEAWRTIEALHRLGLLNVRYPLRVWFGAAWQLARYGQATFAWRLAMQRRVDVQGVACAAIFVRVLRVMAFRNAYLFALCLGLALGMASLVGKGMIVVVPLSLLPPIVMVVGIALHEAGHLYVLRRVSRQADAGWLCAGPLGASVRRYSLPARETLAVALAGPVSPALPGSVMLALGLRAGSIATTLIGVSLVIHLISLGPWASDGKNVLSALKGEKAPGARARQMAVSTGARIRWRRGRLLRAPGGVALVLACGAAAASLALGADPRLSACLLCHCQRGLMIALAALLAWRLWRPGAGLLFAALPVGIAGMAISAYHSLLQWGIVPEALGLCLKGVPCTERQVDLLGFVTLPALSFGVFVAVCMLLLLDGRRSGSLV